MKLTNEELTEALKTIGTHLLSMETFLLTIAQTQATQFKLMNARVTNLTATEREMLRGAASKCESSLERQEHLAVQFRSAFDKFLQP